MRALVTGAAGFIGSHVVRTLLARGCEVRAMHLPRDDLRNLDGLECERLVGDVTDPDTMRRAVHGCDTVFHLAAIYALWLPRPERMLSVNVGGMQTVLRACADAGTARVVATSSIARFGGQGLDQQATESSAFRLGATGDLYARSKAAAHEVAERWADRGLDVVIVAPTGPIGPGDVGPTPTGRLLLSAVRMPLPVLTDTVSNFAHVEDMALGHVLAAERGVRGATYLLGAEDWSMVDVAREALSHAALERPVVTVPHVLAELAGHAALEYTRRVSREAPLFTPAAVRISRLGLRADATRAVRELGLRPRPVRHAIREALTWFARNGYLDDRPAIRARLLACA